MRTQWQSAYLAVVVATIAGGACSVKDTLYCETDQDCADNPGRPYCDVAGVWPQSEGIGKTCIGSPFDAGIPDAGIDADDPDAMRTWSLFEVVGVNETGSIRTPCPSNDGLTLYFTGGEIASEIYVSSRASTSDEFSAATLLATKARFVEVSNDGLELYFTNSDTSMLMVATRATATGTFGLPIGLGVSGNFPSISGDKLALYFIAQTTGPNGEFMRITRAAVGQPWSQPASVSLAGAVQLYASIEISDNELAILRAPLISSTSENLLISRRASKSDAFDQTEVLPAIDTTASWYTSARWRANETEIWVGEPVGGDERPYVSHLQ